MDVIQRSQMGDPEAFAELFNQNKNLVFKTAYLMLGEAESAEDALQEVFLKVHRSIATYHPSKAAFTTWIYRITVNHCLNLRRRRALTTVPLIGAVLRSPAQDPAPDHQLDQSEYLEFVLRPLSAGQRAVVVLRYYWDLPYDEIAQILEIPLGTVKSRLSQALKSIRNELEALPANDHQHEEIAQ